MNLYHFLRTITKLPRPNEIWGDRVSNNWNPLTFYLYLKLCWSQFNTHFGILMQLFNMTIAIGTLLVVSHTDNYGIALIVGLVGLVCAFWAGHIVVVKGVMKQDASLANSQNPELLEIKEDVKELLRRSDKRDLF